MGGADFDVLVLGGGSAGFAAAKAAGRWGARVGLVERGPVGGLCILDGCIPSKTLIRAAHVLHLTRGALAGDGVEVRADFGAYVRRTRALVEELAADRRRQIERARGVELLFGLGRFVGPEA